MITRLTRMQVAHVLAGNDVRGQPCAPALRFPGDADKLRQLELWTQGFLHTAGPRVDIRERTALIRKLAVLMIRNATISAVETSKGLTWLRHRPHLLATRMSFATAISQALEDERRLANSQDASRIGVVLAHSTRACPPRPVIATDGPFSLEELVHPRHLAEAGHAANNCLMVRHHGEPLANRLYWSNIRAGKTRIFAVYSTGQVRMIFQLEGGRMVARQRVRGGQDLENALRTLLQNLARLTGPIDTSLWRQADPFRAGALNISAPESELTLAILGTIPGDRAFTRLSFPATQVTRQLLAETVTHFMRMHPRHTEEERLRFARKAAVYLVRHPVQDNTFRLIRGSTWFASRPETLATNLGFAGAARLQETGWRQFENRQRRGLVRRLKQDMALPYAPPPVLLDRGAYRLTRLIHARHQVEVGLAGAHTLILAYKGRSYPNSRFWSQVREGHRKHFALWQGDDLCATFSLMGRTVMDLQLFQPRASLINIMADVVRIIERTTGPVLLMDHRFLWPRATASPEARAAQ